MLELTDAMVILAVTLIVGLVSYRILTAKSRLELAKYELNLKKTEAARRAASRGSSSQRGQVGGGGPEWLFDVAEELGLGDYLDSDEMPPELARFMPAIKGFIESGGLQKFLGAGGKPGGGSSSVGAGESDGGGGW